MGEWDTAPAATMDEGAAAAEVDAALEAAFPASFCILSNMAFKYSPSASEISCNDSHKISAFR